MYTVTSKPGAKLTTYISKRGSSKQEGWHAHINKVCSGNNNSPELAGYQICRAILRFVTSKLRKDSEGYLDPVCLPIPHGNLLAPIVAGKCIVQTFR